jgi:hypothetical protein
MQWSHKATILDSNADQFRQNIIDDLLKVILEQKNDSKKFLEDQKRQYDLEHQKVNISVVLHFSLI